MIGNVSLLYMNLKNTDSFIILGIPICKHEMSLMDKYTWRYSSSRVTKEIKIKVSVATRMVKMKKKKTNTKIPSTVEKNHWTIYCWQMGCNLMHPLWTLDSTFCSWTHANQSAGDSIPGVTMRLQTSASKQPWKWPTCPSAVEMIKHILWCLHKWLKKKNTAWRRSHPHQNAIVWTDLKQYWARLARVQYGTWRSREATPCDEAGYWWSWWGRVMAGDSKGLW